MQTPHARQPRPMQLRSAVGLTAGVDAQRANSTADAAVEAHGTTREQLMSDPPKNPGTAAVLSLIVPGIGQFYNGDFLRGIFWLIITPGFWIGTGGLFGPLCDWLREFCTRCALNSGPAARSAAEKMGNQPRAYRDIKGKALGWLGVPRDCRSDGPPPGAREEPGTGLAGQLPPQQDTGRRHRTPDEPSEGFRPKKSAVLTAYSRVRPGHIACSVRRCLRSLPW
jgi:hypothetical protein